MRRVHRVLSTFLLFVFAVVGLRAQANTIPGRDLRLQDAFWIEQFRRTGSYPNGEQAIGTWTTVCNPGTSDIPFLAAMNPAHAYIHWIVAREANGRFEQISNWSWVKHTFGSSNDPSPCGVCPMPGLTSFVVVGCNDTYANFQAVDHYWLGPPDEIDPWLGTWNPLCSWFDRGNPPVAPAQQCDGIRSLDGNQAAVLNQAIGDALRVHDDDLVVPGANFFYQAAYLIPHEAEGVRDDNLGSRQFSATWNAGSQQWDLLDASTFVQGSVLQRWSGASLASASNGADDGRFYVAVKVTGPVDGRWHYEYAVQNRDNRRGMGAFRIPVCASAMVDGFGFHDFDRLATTDWTATRTGGEIVFAVNPLQPGPLRWNGIYNFWFDCDAAPLAGAVQCDQYDIGAGALSVAVASTVPTGLWNVHLGAGCGVPQAPVLHADGTPARATLPNPGFTLRALGNPPGSACGFFASMVVGTTPLGGGCTAYTGDVLGLVGIGVIADASGTATLALPVPNSAALEGQALDVQMLHVAPGGAFLAALNLSNGLRVRIGNSIAGCP
ncbi:MAG: hypothetical protein JNK15_01725 [Planctomycetes bacterium]|nr:hypothetical protein [Planctomycetota bacterium]